MSLTSRLVAYDALHELARSNVDSLDNAASFTDPVSGKRWNVAVVMPGQGHLHRPEVLNNGPWALVVFYYANAVERDHEVLGEYATSIFAPDLIDHLVYDTEAVHRHVGGPVSRYVLGSALKHTLQVLHQERRVR